LFRGDKDRNDWAKWMFIADGLMLGRRAAMERAKTDTPKGKGYNMAFGQWMATRHWARDLDPPTRNDLFWCAENRSNVEEWRDMLEPQERVKKNHPTHMKRAYMVAHKPPKEEGEGEEKAKKGNATEEELLKRNLELSQQIVKLKENPFPWWSGAAEQGARSLYEDRGDGGKAEGKARQLLIALAKQIKARFPNQTAQLLDELTAILRGVEPPPAPPQRRRISAPKPKGKGRVTKAEALAAVAPLPKTLPAGVVADAGPKPPLRWKKVPHGWGARTRDGLYLVLQAAGGCETRLYSGDDYALSAAGALDNPRWEDVGGDYATVAEAKAAAEEHYEPAGE
jgi:hypothetical protein